MSEENLSDLLERAADGYSVGAPPVGQMLARSRRARKRRAGLMVLAASAVVGSVIASTTLLFGKPDSPEPSPINTPASKRIAFEGEWRVVALTDDKGRSLLRSDKVRVIFNAGRVSGSTECNRITGSYNQRGADGRAVTFPPVVSTLVLCNETPIALRLHAVRHVTESGTTLYLEDENRAPVATLERVGSLPPTDKPYGNPSIGTVPGENEDQAGQIRAAKIIEADPSYGGVVLGKRLITAYLTSGYDEATVEKARAALNPGDRLKVTIVARTWRELNQINKRFNSLYGEFKRAGARLAVSGIDVARNEVYVKTPDVTKVRRILAANGLGSVDVRYGRYEVATTF